jgi:hypothetical protein
MKVRAAVTVAVIFGAALAAHGADTKGSSALAPPTYSAEQADRGAEIYAERCASCHGSNLDNGQFAASLKGPAFHQHWSNGSLEEPYLVMIRQMPPDDPGGLAPESYSDLLAFILRENSVAAGDKPLPSDPDLLASMSPP